MNSRNSKRPSVPGSRKAEGAKNLRVPKIYISTYNVRTLKDDEKLLELMQELNETKMKWHIIGLAETRRKGELTQIEGGHLLYTKGGDVSMKGVGFLIHQSTDFEGRSDRAASITVKINSRYSLQVIQIYAPTSSHDDVEVEELYEEVTSAMDRRQSHCHGVMGDFNAKIGRHQQSDGATTGMHGLGGRNERGEMMVQFAISNGLTIANTMFKKPAKRKWTWRSPNGEVKNEIDYILVNKKEIMLNIEVINTVNIGSDHRMIRSTVRMNTKMERSRMVKASAPKINIEGLLQKREEFQIELSNRLELRNSRKRD
ncbi:craniofacial development protein 2-like [Xenia sp. Carnegie-2017]|uniref:craniofacial development protein 2-like n=1 Tax=Xenia sp. Carnegie-2017 TaxID=2897299 RepID=UPI001F049751|nr:craniofacial development protein 2-like [Xenia sp. Carnegie-2017]